MRRLIALVVIAGWSAGARPAGAVACDGTIHQGPATYYDFADGTGVCGYPAETGNQMVVALDAPELGGTSLCGACIHVWGPSGEVTVLVVNGCPGCEAGHLDLSPQAFALIANGYQGVPPITWQYVPCEVTGPIRYAYYPGSTTNWAWVQVRNHRHPIASFEARMADGSFTALERSDWGYFKALNLPAGTQTYRVTDLYGQVLEDTGIAVLDEGEVEGHGQFPSCSGSAGGGGLGTAGSGTRGGSGAAAAGAATNDPAETDCGCRVASRPSSSGALAMGLLVLLTALGRARRRGTDSRSPRA